MNQPDVSPKHTYSIDFLGRWRRFMAQASDRAIFGLLFIFISGILLICILGIFLVEWLRYQPSNIASVASANEVTATTTSTPSPNNTTTIIETPTQIVNNTTITLNTGIQTSLVQVASPARIIMGEQALPVYPETITAEDLLNITPYEDVRWVQNSIVNYVFQLPNTPMYQQLLQSAQPGDRIELIGSSGDVKVYTVEEVVPAAPTLHNIRQDEPAVTLILSGEKPLVVRGQFSMTAENETIFPASQTGVSVGETAVIGHATLAIQKATQLHAAENIPIGYMLYQIEFELTNNDEDSINSSWFTFVLVDDVGNQYQNQQATAASPELLAGQSIQHVVAFQVPASLSNSVFNLFVSRIDGPDTVNVALPHTQTTVQASHIDLMEAQLSTDDTLLLLMGEVSNLGTDPLSVQADDISLQSEGQSYLIFEATPPLPWIVQPGMDLPFLLRTQRPSASEAVIKIQGQAFFLQNLR